MTWAGGISWAFPVCAHCVWWTQITPLSASVGNAGASAEQLVCAGTTAQLLMDWNELWNPQHMKTPLKLSLDKVWGLKKTIFAWEAINVITPCDEFHAFFCDYLLLVTVGASCQTREHFDLMQLYKIPAVIATHRSWEQLLSWKSIFKSSKMAFVVSSYLKLQ